MSRFRKDFVDAEACENQPGLVPTVLLQQARKTGQLNLSNKQLKDIPTTVWRLNAPPSEGDDDFSSSDRERWWEQVDLTKLILASNALGSISENVSMLFALVVLDIHDNKLTHLPNTISSLEALEKLDVSHNKLESLPEGVCELSRLATLLVQHNDMTSLPQNLSRLASLRVLDASHNKVFKLSSDFGRMPNIQRLDLSNNQVLVLPDGICQLPLLSFLDLSHNKLSSLPQSWEKLASIKELYFRNNVLASIPDFSACVTLKELYLGRNALTGLSMTGLPDSLMIIEVRDNKIKELSEDIVKIKELRRLDLANNDISTLPPKLGLMEHVKVLNVEGNPMRGIRRDIISKGTIAIMRYLHTRVVDENSENGSDLVVQKSGSFLPMSAEVEQRTKLHELASTKSLDLSNKPWSADSFEGCGEIALEVLDISRTVIVDLPSEIYQFQSSLKVLNASLNKISVLGFGIGGFQSLTHLNLSTNMLSNLPTELGYLGSLIELNIMQNKLTLLPECIFSMESLEHLLASGNRIAKIDVDGLRKLQKLSTLALQNNSISQVPPELGLLSSIRNLQLEGNVFRIPRQNVLQQGTQAVLDYLKGRVPTS